MGEHNVDILGVRWLQADVRGMPIQSGLHELRMVAHCSLAGRIKNSMSGLFLLLAEASVGKVEDPRAVGNLCSMANDVLPR